MEIRQIEAAAAAQGLFPYFTCDLSGELDRQMLRRNHHVFLCAVTGEGTSLWPIGAGVPVRQARGTILVAKRCLLVHRCRVTVISPDRALKLLHMPPPRAWAKSTFKVVELLHHLAVDHYSMNSLPGSFERETWPLWQRLFQRKNNPTMVQFITQAIRLHSH